MALWQFINFGTTVHHVLKCMSSHKVIVGITGKEHYFYFQRYLFKNSKHYKSNVFQIDIKQLELAPKNYMKTQAEGKLFKCCKTTYQIPVASCCLDFVVTVGITAEDK